MPITAKQADNAKATGKRYRLNDGHGLQLEVRPSGSKYWVHRYRNPNTKKPTVYTIGMYPHITIHQARVTLLDIKGLIRKRIDPNAQRRHELQHGKGVTFRNVAKEWHANQLNRWTHTNAAQVLISLERDVFPFIGEQSIAELDRPEILQIIRRIEARGSLAQAAKVRQRINAVLDYAMDMGKIKYNPTPSTGVMKARGQSKHFNAITTEQLPNFLQDLMRHRHEVMRRAVQFALLTFARTGSIRMAEWKEIDWDKSQWVIPAEHMKIKKPHIIPLSKQAMQLLKELRTFTGDSTLLFYARHRHKMLSANALRHVLKNIGWGTQTTIHGFRALASSVLHDAGYPLHVIEKQLAHAERNKVAGAYNYMAQYMEERCKMMQWWADYLQQSEKDNAAVRS